MRSILEYVNVMFIKPSKWERQEPNHAKRFESSFEIHEGGSIETIIIS